MGGIDGERLLAQDVFAGLQTEHHILVMVRVRSGDIDDVDVRIRNELLVRAISLCTAGRADVLEELLGTVGAGGRGGGNDRVNDVGYAPGLGIDQKILGESLSDTTGGCEVETGGQIDVLMSWWGNRWAGGGDGDRNGLPRMPQRISFAIFSTLG